MQKWALPTQTKLAQVSWRAVNGQHVTKIPKSTWWGARAPGPASLGQIPVEPLTGDSTQSKFFNCSVSVPSRKVTVTVAPLQRIVMRFNHWTAIRNLDQRLAFSAGFHYYTGPVTLILRKSLLSAQSCIYTFIYHVMIYQRPKVKMPG